MNMSTLTMLFLIIFGVTLTLCAGGIGGPAERCLCTGHLPWVKRVKISKVETFLPSSSCPKTEIVITLKRTSRKVCLDPDGQLGQAMLSKPDKKPRRGSKKLRGKNQKKQP